MRKLVRVLVILAALGFSAAAFVNVYGDDTALRRDAEAEACPRGCAKATSVSYERTPFFETVTYLVPDGTIKVRCSRAAILFGPYSCVKE